jgi:hypothetical protein
MRPIFLPDRKKMAVCWDRGDTQGVSIISLEPHSETLLLSGVKLPIGWSPDGKYVYAIPWEPVVAREIIRVQVGAPNEVTSAARLPGEIADFDGASVSPDGKAIVVTIGEEKSDVW